MGWSTTVIAPPDGDMAAYVESLRLVLGRDDAVLWPTHGGPVTEPRPTSRRTWSTGSSGSVRCWPASGEASARIPDIVAELYVAVPEELHPAAARSVLAHLVKLVDEGQVDVDGAPALDAVFSS